LRLLSYPIYSITYVLTVQNQAKHLLALG